MPENTVAAPLAPMQPQDVSDAFAYLRGTFTAASTTHVRRNPQARGARHTAFPPVHPRPGLNPSVPLRGGR